MDDALTRQLVRQLKIMNFWIASFGILLLAGLVVGGILLFQALTFVKDATQNITNLTQTTQQNIDLKNRLCSGSGTFTSLLRTQTDVCN